MTKRLYQILDFEQIKDKLTKQVSCQPTRGLALDLEPSFDFDEIKANLEETNQARALVARKGYPEIKGIMPVEEALFRAEKAGLLNFSDLLNISNILYISRRCIEYISDLDIDTNDRLAIFISKIQASRKLEEDISRAIISKEEMADNASPKLNDIRRKINASQNSIKDRLNELIRSVKYQKAIQESLVTIRSGRYCIPVKAEYRQLVPGIVHDTSASGQTLFIEPSYVVDANNKIRELGKQEEEEIERILRDFSNQVAQKADLIHENYKRLIHIDFVFAKAKLAISMDAIMPGINEDGYIDIINGRHPLIPKEEIVPISINLGDSFSTLVITGPNTGGKTVSLKTVGLFTLMMQAGLLIPADRMSQLSVFKKIFADIGDEQSIEQSLSTFSSHMTNIVKILDECDSESLVLFDELGAGTDPTEGAALAMSILEYVHALGAKTIATTHYSEIKVFAHTREGYTNASCEFSLETLKPTYRLLIGIPGKSNAFAISKRLGLSDHLIERAREYLTSDDIRFEDMLHNIDKTQKELDYDRDQARILKRDAEIIKRDIDREKEETDEKKNEILTKARYDARDILNRARIQADRLVDDIRKKSYNLDKESLREAEERRAEIINLQSQLDSEFASNIEEEREVLSEVKEGDRVYIYSLNNEGIVLTKADKDGKVLVQAGIMKISLDISDLKLMKKKEEKEINKSKNKMLVNASNIRTELDLRGLMVEEAIDVIDKHIDSAQVAKQKQFSVIHGKGTGALRKGIHQFLRGDKRVKEFRLGTFGEGDSGVTIIGLK